MNELKIGQSLYFFDKRSNTVEEVFVSHFHQQFVYCSNDKIGLPNVIPIYKNSLTTLAPGNRIQFYKSKEEVPNDNMKTSINLSQFLDSLIGKTVRVNRKIRTVKNRSYPEGVKVVDIPYFEFQSPPQSSNDFSIVLKEEIQQEKWAIISWEIDYDDHSKVLIEIQNYYDGGWFFISVDIFKELTFFIIQPFNENELPNN